MFESPNEHCWVLLGHAENDLWWGRMHRMTIGGPSRVDFDPDWVIKQEEENQNVIGWIHSHPGMTSHYSAVDDVAMKGWSVCMGKPLVCCIHGTDGLSAWWYVDDESTPERYQVKRVGKIIFGVTPELYESDVVEALNEEAVE